ncbi:MAG: dTDP-glucose 4,6-dehydratase [Acidimicrobiales bacterium]
MRVVITGGAGFIGSRLAHYWRREHPDDDLIVLDALTYAGHRESLRDLEGREGFQFVQVDICDESRVATELRDVDLVIHLAAETHNDRAVTDPMPFVRANVVGTVTLLEACRRAGVPRFHHVSTDEVFGSLPLSGTEKFTESSPYAPRGPYSASKAAADHFVRAWHETYGLRVTLSNCSNNFGPAQHPEKLIALAITRLLSGGKVPVYGDGKNVRDWIFVEDHCSAIDVITHRGRPGATYLVSAESELPNIEVVLRILARLDKESDWIEFVPDRPGHDRRYALDASRLREELGWAPTVGFEMGLDRTIDWYRQNEAWWRPMISAPATPANSR